MSNIITDINKQAILGVSGLLIKKKKDINKLEEKGDPSGISYICTVCIICGHGGGNIEERKFNSYKIK